MTQSAGDDPHVLKGSPLDVANKRVKALEARVDQLYGQLQEKDATIEIAFETLNRVLTTPDYEGTFNAHLIGIAKAVLARGASRELKE